MISNHARDLMTRMNEFGKTNGLPFLFLFISSNRNPKYQGNRMKIVSRHVGLMSDCKRTSQSRMINWYKSDK